MEPADRAKKLLAEANQRYVDRLTRPPLPPTPYLKRGADGKLLISLTGQGEVPAAPITTGAIAIGDRVILKGKNGALANQMPHRQSAIEEPPISRQKHRIKYLYSMTQGSERIFYVGGWQKDPIEVCRYPASRGVEVGFSNLGGDRWIAAFKYNIGSVNVQFPNYVSAQSIDVIDSFSSEADHVWSRNLMDEFGPFSPTSIIQNIPIHYYGYGFWGIRDFYFILDGYSNTVVNSVGTITSPVIGGGIYKNQVFEALGSQVQTYQTNGPELITTLDSTWITWFSSQITRTAFAATGFSDATISVIDTTINLRPHGRQNEAGDLAIANDRVDAGLNRNLIHLISADGSTKRIKDQNGVDLSGNDIFDALEFNDWVKNQFYLFVNSNESPLFDHRTFVKNQSFVRLQTRTIDTDSGVLFAPSFRNEKFYKAPASADIFSVSFHPKL